ADHFILGDSNLARHDREKAMLRRAIRNDDGDKIKAFLGNEAETLVGSVTGSSIDVIHQVVRPLSVRMCSNYFGVWAGSYVTEKITIATDEDALLFGMTKGSVLAPSEDLMYGWH